MTLISDESVKLILFVCVCLFVLLCSGRKQSDR